MGAKVYALLVLLTLATLLFGTEAVLEVPGILLEVARTTLEVAGTITGSCIIIATIWLFIWLSWKHTDFIISVITLIVGFWIAIKYGLL